MQIEKVKKLSNLQILAYWIKERESIRLKKEQGLPKPWTDDETLQKYRFCNVRRMDDKVSRWFLDNWFEPYFDHPNMLLACVMGRNFNRPEALAEVTNLIFCKGPPKLGLILDKLRKIKNSGSCIFGGAYMIRGTANEDKAKMVLYRVVKPMLSNPPAMDRTSMQRCVESLLTYWGFRPFLAGQVVADYRWAVKGSFEDRDTWAPLGPGSLRGINKLHGRLCAQPLPQDQFVTELNELIGLAKPLIPVSVTNRMEAMDWQNCLCEFDKYTRIFEKLGHPKQKYPGV